INSGFFVVSLYNDLTMHGLSQVDPVSRHLVLLRHCVAVQFAIRVRVSNFRGWHPNVCPCETDSVTRRHQATPCPERTRPCGLAPRGHVAYPKWTDTYSRKSRGSPIAYAPPGQRLPCKRWPALPPLRSPRQRCQIVARPA